MLIYTIESLDKKNNTEFIKFISNAINVPSPIIFEYVSNFKITINSHFFNGIVRFMSKDLKIHTDVINSNILSENGDFKLLILEKYGIKIQYSKLFS